MVQVYITNTTDYIKLYKSIHIYYVYDDRNGYFKPKTINWIIYLWIYIYSCYEIGDHISDFYISFYITFVIFHPCLLCLHFCYEHLGSSY